MIVFPLIRSVDVFEDVVVEVDELLRAEVEGLLCIDRAVLAFAGMVLASVALAWYVSCLRDAFDGVCGLEHAPGRIERLLPGSPGLQEAGAEGKQFIQVRAVVAAAETAALSPS